VGPLKPRTNALTGPDLPAPSPLALAHSQQLAAAIADEISNAGGWIGFARYMELALYAPGLGYYSAGNAKFGPEGDFVTAPEISNLFGATLASQFADLLSPEQPDLLELGAGNGKLARDLLTELDRLGKLPGRYLILETSAELRERQRRLIGNLAPELAARVHWLDALPEKFRGIVIGNEVLDALPVHIVEWRNTETVERGVAMGRAGDLVWQERPVTGALREAALATGIDDLSPGSVYVSEISLAAPALVATISERLEQGVILFIDYGFPRREYYHPQRTQGTLMCHYRHRAHADPFYLPGLQDITAHVDFSLINEAAAGSGLRCLGYATQAQFLINGGITDLMLRVPPDDAVRYLPLAAAAQKLLSPSEMGELFKMIAFGRGIDLQLKGFASGDMRARLG
jgi:SAM-dependent MidA family methyltransferase